MTDTDEPQYRQNYRADREDSGVREVEEHDDGTFSVRMPIASTGEVRNEGDDPLSRSEIDGMAQQLADRQIGVFPGHGRDGTIAAGRYSPFEKLGYWDDGAVEEREASDDALLMANARFPDPEELPAATGAYREGLAILKEQALRGISMDASIGWRDDESFPGGVDLMEASIVGIGADWRTNSQETAAMARAAVEAGADPATFVETVRDAVMGAEDVDPEERHLSDQQAEMARVLVDAYREAQGDGSVGNFEGWLFNVAWYEFDEDQFHAAQTALSEWFRETTPLDEPVSERFVPFLDDRGDGDGDNENSMTDSDSDASDDESGDTNREEQDGMDSEEYRETMLELQRQQTETLNTLAAAIREDGDDDDDDDDDDGEEEDDDDGDDEDEENSADSPDGEQSGDPDELREHLEALREGGYDVSDLNIPEPEDEQSADGEDGETDEQGRSNDDSDSSPADGWLEA